MKQRSWLIGVLALAALMLAGLPAHPHTARANPRAELASPETPARAALDQGGIGGPVKDVAVEAGRVYVTQASGLSVFDVSAPDSPALLTRMSLPWVPLGLAAAGGYAYTFAQGTNMVAVIDLRTPGQGQIVTTFPFGGSGYGALALHNGYLYLARSDGDPLTVVDVRDPLRPSTVGSVKLPNFGYPQALRVAGSRAYAVSTNSPDEILFVLDVSNPGAPTLQGTLALEYKLLNDLAVVGSSVLISDIHGVDLIDVSDPAKPVKRARLEIEEGAGAITVEGQRAYILTDNVDSADNELVVADVQSPTVLQQVGRIGIPGQQSAVPVVGGLAYVVNGVGRPVGLRVLDVRNLVQPLTRGTVRMVGEIQKVRVVGQQVAVLENSLPTSALRTLDASDPDTLRPLGVVELAGEAWELESSGSFAYVGLKTSGQSSLPSVLQVIDLTSPVSPTLRGSLPLPEPILGMKVQGTSRFVLDLKGLQVVDVSQPDQPALRGRLDLRSFAFLLAVSGSRAYAVGRELHVLDISDLDHPSLLGRTEGVFSSVGGDVVVAGERLFVGFNEPQDRVRTAGVIATYDVSAPTAPQRIGRLLVGPELFRLIGRGSQLSAATRDGVVLIDASDPARLQRQPGDWGIRYAHDLAETNSRLYVQNEGGLRIMRTVDRRVWLPQVRR